MLQIARPPFIVTCLVLVISGLIGPGCTPRDAQPAGPAAAIRADALRPGMKAPDLDLPRLRGGRFSLSEHRGRDIVVLDFWNSRFGNYRETLPVLQDLARQYRGRDVTFYAVNLGEEESRVRTLVRDEDITLAVLLDRQLRASAAYRVHQPPHVVLIDRDGLIRAIYTRDTDNLRERLRREIDTLLDHPSL